MVADSFPAVTTRFVLHQQNSEPSRDAHGGTLPGARHDVKIRSICVGIDAAWPLDTEAIGAAGALLSWAATLFGEAGIEVQTPRLALSPFAEAGPADDASWVTPFALALQDACKQEGIGFTSIGPIRWGRLGPEAGRRYASALADAM